MVSHLSVDAKQIMMFSGSNQVIRVYNIGQIPHPELEDKYNYMG